LKLSPVFIVLFVVLTTILLVELPKKQRSTLDYSEADYSTPECVSDECYRDTPSADELNAIFFSRQ